VCGAQELTPGEAMNALMRSAIVLVLSMGACTLLAQSLGEVARETRKTPHPRAKKVVTNDEIPSVDTMSTAPASAKTNATAGAQGSEKAAAKAPEEQKKLEAELNSKFSAEQDKISLMERELKVAEQEFKQKQIAHMADANARVNNQQQYAEAERLDREDLAQKQEKLNAEREKLSGMQEEARHAGVKLPD
jgi:diacylglycerol kinase family enzyme